MIVSDSRVEHLYGGVNDVFVIYTIDWSVDSIKIQPFFEDTAKELSNVPNLVFGSYDISLNDPMEEPIKAFPDFHFWAKNEQPIHYDGSLSPEGFKAFLK